MSATPHGRGGVASPPSPEPFGASGVPASPAPVPARGEPAHPLLVARVYPLSFELSRWPLRPITGHRSPFWAPSQPATSISGPPSGHSPRLLGLGTIQLHDTQDVETAKEMSLFF